MKDVQEFDNEFHAKLDLAYIQCPPQCRYPVAREPSHWVPAASSQGARAEASFVADEVVLRDDTAMRLGIWWRRRRGQFSRKLKEV